MPFGRQNRPFGEAANKMPSPSDPSLDPYADPDYYEHPKPHRSKKIEITWSVLHLTYVGLFTCGLEAALETLEKSFKAKGYALQKISAIEEKVTACRMIGPEPYPHTHIAIDINKGEAERFKTNGLTIFTIEGNTPQVPHVRFVKTTGHWNHVWSTYHYKEPGASPLQRSGDGPLRRMPPKTVQVSKKEKMKKIRHERNQAAYDAFCRTNTFYITKIHELLRDSGMSTKMWIPYVRNAEDVADYYHQNHQALVFTNNWSGECIAKDMQESITSGYNPPLIILVLNRTGQDIIPYLQDICKLSEYIVTGGLQYRKATRHDVPLSTWRPNVIVFARFNPIDLTPDWTQLLAGSLTSTGHILASHTSYEQMEHVSSQLPNPHVCVLPIHTVRRALFGCELKPPLAHEINIDPVDRAARIFYDHFTPHMLKRYWEEGYHPVIAFIGIFDTRRKAKISDIVGPTQPVDPDDLEKSIGRTIQMGGLIIKSIQLDDEEKEQQRLEYEQAAVRALIVSPDQAREIVEKHGQMPTQPRLTAPPINVPVDPLTARREALFGTHNDPSPGPATREIDNFLIESGAVKGYPTPTPYGKVWSNGWVNERHQMVIEIDSQPPNKGDEYKMLYWWSQGYQIIRIRADDLGQDWGQYRTWMLELEHALLRPQSFFQYLNRTPNLDSWASLRENVSPYTSFSAPHLQWWKDQIDPDLDPEAFFTSLQTPRPMTPAEEPEIPLAQPCPGSAVNGSTAAPITTPRKTGWAIYCRADEKDGLTSDALDQHIMLQQLACIAYAQKYGLEPVAGPQQMFEDRCPPNAPFDARPGLTALRASGAVGMLCVDRWRFSDCTGNPAGWLAREGLVFRSVSGS
jgi:hypothetical protein